MPHSYIPLVIMLLVFGLVVRRSLRGRRIKVDTLWVIPVLLIAVAVSMIAQSPPHDPATIAALAVATLLGAGVGWQRGRLTRISRDPETGVLTSQASPAAVMLILGLFVARFALRYWIMQNPGKGQNLAAAADALVLFSFATLIVARLEMWLRCKRLIAAGAGQA